MGWRDGCGSHSPLLCVALCVSLIHVSMCLVPVAWMWRMPTRVVSEGLGQHGADVAAVLVQVPSL